MEQKSEKIVIKSELIKTKSSDNINDKKANFESKNFDNKNLNYQKEIKICIGNYYQAVCPPLIPESERKNEDLNEHALLVWAPTDSISDTQIQTFIMLAHEKYGYNNEQALAMLHWHKYNVELATDDLKKFIPLIEEWTPEDKKLFEDALLFHGKNFQRIKELLPHKTIGGLIKHYYASKKKGRRLRHNKNRID